MSTRERIMTIRLIDKASKYPGYAASLGIAFVTELGCIEDTGKPP